MTRLERLLGASATLLALFGLGLRGREELTPFAVAALILFGLHGTFAVVLAGHTRARGLWSGRPRLIQHGLNTGIVLLLVAASGGASSPFVGFLLYPVVSAGLLWGARAGFWIAVAVIIMYALLIIAWMTDSPQGVLPPFSLQFFGLAAAGGLLAYLTLPLRRWLLRLGEEEASLASILGGIADGALICDSKRRVRFLNAAAAEMLALEPGDAMGHDVLDFLPDLQALICPPEAGSFDSQPAREVIARRLDGTTFPVELTVGSIRLGEGRMHVGIVRDVSARKRVEAEERRALEAKVAEEERVRLVHDLHDGLLQTLTGAALQIRNIENLIDRDPARARARLVQVREALAAEQRELRFWAGEVKPELLSAEPETLEDRLQATLERVRHTWGIETGLRYRVEGTLPPGPRQQVYRIVQEAVVNAARHSGGTMVEVGVGSRGGFLVIDVADNGHGFAFTGKLGHDQLADQQVGPVLLRHRIAAARGTLSIDSGPEGGRLEIVLPAGGAA